MRIICRGYRLCHSNYVTFWKRKSDRDIRKISSYQGLGEGGMNRQSTEEFQGSGSILCETIMVNFQASHMLDQKL